MRSMKNFLRSRAYRTCAIIASAAAFVVTLSVTGTGSIEEDEQQAVGAVSGQAFAVPEETVLSFDIVSLDAVIVSSPAEQEETTVSDPVYEEETMASEIQEETTSVGIQEETEQTITEIPESEPVNLPQVTQKGLTITVTEEDYEALQRIVEAEAGNQDEIGRILVANVIINRVYSDKYPDSITANIFKRSGNIYQFEPISNGYYYAVTVSDKTKECVDRALNGEDYSQGALYFTRQTSPDSWFNTSLTFLFIHGAHYFYK